MCAQGIILFLSNIHKIPSKIRYWNTFAYTHTPAIKNNKKFKTDHMLRIYSKVQCILASSIVH